MDIGHLFETLDSDHRSITLSVVLCFPLAYLDCWKLSATFRSLEIYPQTMLALAIAVLFSFGGFAFNIVHLAYTKAKGNWVLFPKIMILPAAGATILIFFGPNISPGIFVLAYIALAFLITHKTIRMNKNGKPDKPQKEEN